MKLTNANVARLKLPPGKSDHIFWDSELPRFGLRLRGKAGTWIAQYRTESGQRREKIGTTAALSADAARKKAKQVLAKVQLGHDPVAEKRERKARAAETFGIVVSRYLDLRDPEKPGDSKFKMRARYFLEAKRHLNVQAKALHRLPIASLERKSIAAVLSGIAAASGPVAADRCRASLSCFFSWAIAEGLAETNAATGTNRHAESKARQRVLANDELVDVWNACQDDDYGRIVRLLLLTGQRREEVGAICDAEISLEKRLWSLPSERTKNDRPHDVPLSDAALQILADARKARTTNGKTTPSAPSTTNADTKLQGRPFLFGRGKGSFSGWSRAKESLDERIAALRKQRDAGPLLDWRLHDLRRTVATGMAELGVLPHIIEAVLNHVSGHKAGVAGVYNQAVYAAEKGRALDLWADHLQALVVGKPSNIIALHTA